MRHCGKLRNGSGTGSRTDATAVVGGLVYRLGRQAQNPRHRGHARIRNTVIPPSATPPSTRCFAREGRAPHGMRRESPDRPLGDGSRGRERIRRAHGSDTGPDAPALSGTAWMLGGRSQSRSGLAATEIIGRLTFEAVSSRNCRTITAANRQRLRRVPRAHRAHDARTAREVLNPDEFLGRGTGPKNSTEFSISRRRRVGGPVPAQCDAAPMAVPDASRAAEDRRACGAPRVHEVENEERARRDRQPRPPLKKHRV